MKDAIGWCSALILMAALWTQLARQWRAPSVEGVSSWLFAGQALASTGFTIYSAMLGSVVFVVVNSLLLLTALAGWACLLLKRARIRREERREQPPAARMHHADLSQT